MTLYIDSGLPEFRRSLESMSIEELGLLQRELEGEWEAAAAELSKLAVAHPFASLKRRRQIRLASMEFRYGLARLSEYLLLIEQARAELAALSS